MDNNTIANFFWDIAKILELKDENPFRIRSYQRAAQNIENYPEEIEEIYKTKGLKALEEIPGIGESIAAKIEEAIKFGKPQIIKKLDKEVPHGLLEIMSVQGIGPKLAKMLYEKKGIKDLSGLEKAAKQGKIKGLPGIEDKKIENILKGIEVHKAKSSKFYIGNILPLAESLVNKLKTSKYVDNILVCGSLRRFKETIGDIDILVTSKEPKKIMDAFISLRQVKQVIAKGDIKSSIVLENNIDADLRVVEEKSFGAASHYFTGSKQHNIKMRTIAIKKHLKLNEYGVFKGKKMIAGRTEDEIFKALGLRSIPPEIREDSGEIEAARMNKLPKLVEITDIKGDLHTHSNYTDGADSIEDMAKAAQALGYEYIAITDHSQAVKVAGGLTEKELLKQIKEIDNLNKIFKDFTILKGCEVDIKPDGTLDMDDEILKKLDIVVAAVHSRFGMDEDAMTKRIIKALENKYVTIIAHPTGRLLSRRDPYKVNIEKIIDVAASTGKALELNSFPDRLDLNDKHCRLAKEKKVMISIDTDAHSIKHLNYIRFGIGTARRGWIEKKDVLNCMGLKQLKQNVIL